MPGEIDDSLLDEVRGCITSKKNPDKCIDKILDEHGIDKEKKATVLTQVIKKMNPPADVPSKEPKP